jgi:hypothetical protein
VIKLPFTATLKGHVQILNPLLEAGFRRIRADFLYSRFCPLELRTTIWRILDVFDKGPKPKNPANQ